MQENLCSGTMRRLDSIVQGGQEWVLKDIKVSVLKRQINIDVGYGLGKGLGFDYGH